MIQDTERDTTMTTRQKEALQTIAAAGKWQGTGINQGTINSLCHRKLIVWIWPQGEARGWHELTEEGRANVAAE